jgi:5'-methylthioadenosine phosphorylase
MVKRSASIGVIGGSGLYALDGLERVREVRVRTPFGEPSDAVVIGDIAGISIAFLPRHGRGHRLLPTEVNSQANIAALKSLGVGTIVAFSAVGSLKEELAPLDFVIPSQLIDRTRSRRSTFFGDGVVGHVAFADPFSKPLASLLYAKARELGLKVHRDETLVCMEGPAFSTRAESHLYRGFGAGLINMSALPEAKLAREAEISYALVCMVTDYDCWREEAAGHCDVDIQMVIANLNRNAENAKRLLVSAIADVAALVDDSGCRTAARNAIITDRKAIPRATLAKLDFLFPGEWKPPAKPAARTATNRPAAKRPAAKKPARRRAAVPRRRR